MPELPNDIGTRTDLIRDQGDGYCFSDLMTRDVVRGEISAVRQKESRKAAEKRLCRLA